MKKLILSFCFFACAISFSLAQNIDAPATLQSTAEASQGIVLGVTNTSANTTNGNNDLTVQTTGTDRRTQITVIPSGTNTSAFLQVANSSDPANTGVARLGARGDHAIFTLTNKGTPTSSLKHFAIELDAANVFADEAFVITQNAFNVDGTPTVLAKVHGSGLETIEAKVQASVAAPDYVFKSDYNLRSLEEVESFIQEHSHLPEIPSAAEFEAEGIKLGKMSFDLLKKVEELTLYMIELKKENEELKKRVNSLEKK